MKTKQQIVGEFRRKEIVDAARSAFARKGFVDTVVDVIAKDAGVAKGTVYLYFRSKREIYRAVLHDDMVSLNRSTLERIDAAKSLQDKIEAFILVRVENAETKKEFFRIMDTESGSLSFTRRQYRDWLSEPVLRLATAIEQASQCGEIRSGDCWRRTELRRARTLSFCATSSGPRWQSNPMLGSSDSLCDWWNKAAATAKADSSATLRNDK